MESAEIERELEELESRVERLRGLYEQYFMGLEKIEPQIPRKDIDRRIWVLRREQIRNTGLRFKFQMLIQRYNTFQQYWGRVTREIENGTYRRDVMRAAARFGEKEALTILGKKRAKQYKSLLDNQLAKREAGKIAVQAILGGADAVEATAAPAVEPGWGDITEVMDADDVPTPAPSDLEAAHAPTSPSAGRAAPPPRAPPPPPGRPAPLGMQPPPPPGVAPTPLPLGGRGAGGLGDGAAAGNGLRWGAIAGRPRPGAVPPAAASDTTLPQGTAMPSSSVKPAAAPADPRRRVAELAAEMRARKSGQGSEIARAGLDLDFDGDMTLPRPLGDASAPARPVASVPSPPAAPKRRRSSKSMRAVRPPTAEPTAPSPVAPAAPRIQNTAAWNEATQLSTRRKLAAAGAVAGHTPPVVKQGEPTTAERRPVAAGPQATSTPSAPRGAVPPPKPSEPTSAEPAAGKARRPPPEDLSDQRIRQIYAKYVETKRDANESTAGVTYERLAESLRAQASKLRTSHPTKSVDYEVVTKDGKTMLKPILR